MSFELIKNYLYEKNTTPSNIYIELSSFKTFSYLLIDSLLTKSKTTFSIINFDPLYYRFCLSSGKSIPKTIFDSNQTFDTLQFDNNLIIIGADLLPSDSLNNFLQTFSQKKVGTVLFITNSQRMEGLPWIVQNFSAHAPLFTFVNPAMTSKPSRTAAAMSSKRTVSGF